MPTLFDSTGIESINFERLRLNFEHIRPVLRSTHIRSFGLLFERRL